MPAKTTSQADLIVLGAGPAGAHAALQAASHGLRVILLDDGAAAGGQVWRAPMTDRARQLSSGDADRLAGDELRQKLAQSGVDYIPAAEIWSVSAGFEVAACCNDIPMLFHAPALIVALGAVERVVPFPGWTLPGVFGLAAATALIKREGKLPGKRFAIAGQGPLLVAVAAKSIAAGMVPLRVIDTASRHDWLKAAMGFASSPRELARGVGWTTTLVRNRVPRDYGSTVVAASGKGRLESIRIAPLGKDGRPRESGHTTIDVDTLFVGNGLTPLAEVPRLLGASHSFDALQGGLRVERDGCGRTSVPGLYAVGDGAGIRGAALAAIAGSLAGIAAASDAARLDTIPAEQLSAPFHRRHRRLERCANASCTLMLVTAKRIDSVPPETIVCRCENITRQVIDDAAATGVRGLDELKQHSRLGMGPCQGRMCAENAAVLLGLKTGARENSGWLTQRIPLRPIPIGQLTGEFIYQDIPVPEPAPL